MTSRWEEARRERDEIRAWCDERSPMPGVPQEAKDIVWRLAWEHGHSSGREEICFHYDEFADIAREAAIAQEARMSDDLVKQKKVTEGEVCPEASSLVKWVVETELAKHIEELEAKLAKAVARSDKLAYWLDIDQDLWDAFTVMKKSDHRHMQSEIQAIKDILTGGKDD